jgi:hypothetical protein
MNSNSNIKHYSLLKILNTLVLEPEVRRKKYIPSGNEWVEIVSMEEFKAFSKSLLPEIEKSVASVPGLAWSISIYLLRVRQVLLSEVKIFPHQNRTLQKPPNRQLAQTY